MFDADAVFLPIPVPPLLAQPVVAIPSNRIKANISVTTNDCLRSVAGEIENLGTTTVTRLLFIV